MLCTVGLCPDKISLELEQEKQCYKDWFHEV